MVYQLNGWFMHTNKVIVICCEHSFTCNAFFNLMPWEKFGDLWGTTIYYCNFEITMITIATLHQTLPFENKAYL